MIDGVVAEEATARVESDCGTFPQYRPLSCSWVPTSQSSSPWVEVKTRIRIPFTPIPVAIRVGRIGSALQWHYVVWI